MAAKKGGGLKQNLVWIVIVGGLGALAYFTLLSGNSTKMAATTGKKGSVAAVSTPKTTAKAGSGGGAAQDSGAKNLGASFNLSAKSGGALGGSYLLKNLSISKNASYESANIFLKSVSGTGSFAEYGASISGSTITVTLSDTKNFDLDAGGPSYSGENPLIVNGSVIKSISWAQNGEDSIRINIVLKKQAVFDDVVLTSPPTLEIRVAI